MDQSNVAVDEMDPPNTKTNECQIEQDDSNSNPENGNDTIFIEDLRPASNGNEGADNDNTEPALSDSDCLVRLVFRDNDAFDECHTLIGKCVRDALFEMKKAINVTVNRTENSINIHEISSNENDESQFMVDTLPAECTNEAEIPDYHWNAIDVLNNVDKDTDANDDDDNDAKQRGAGAGNCWNCGGDHTIKDCKEKRDPVAIMARKQMFAQKTKVERYHLDAEQRYSHLVPGRISKDLREALGLRSRELPLYIYKMRLYGYPEGWLEEAKINSSGLTMFHSEKRSSTDMQTEEDGEEEKATYDASKFIEYPGFNAPVPSNLIDEGDYYRVPPMEFCNSKEGLTQLLQHNLANPYKRRKRIKLDGAEQPSSISPQNDDDDDDMEIQNSDDEPADRPVQFASSKPITSESDLNESNSNNLPDDTSSEAFQLSLLELKKKQEEILRALENESSDSNSNPTPVNQSETPQNGTEINAIENNNTEDVNENPCDETMVGENDTIPNVEPNENDAEVDALNSTSVENAEPTEIISNHLEPNVPNTPSPSVAGQSRIAMFGTPLIKQVSPFSKLPTGEKWSVGVTDVIDFENLPNATGAFSKLTGVIDKVRTVIKRINDDNEHDDAS